MLEQVFAVSGIATAGLGGLAASNFLYDRGVPSTQSRYAAPILGGGAFMVAVLWLDAWTGTALSGALALGILALRSGFRRGLRGLEGTLPTQAWAEVTYAMAGTAGLAIGWGLLGDRWLAFVPIAFMAWGDSAAGLLRATIRSRNVGSLWPSLAMLGVCLAAADPLSALLDRRRRGSGGYRCRAPQTHGPDHLGRQPACRGHFPGRHGRAD